MKRRLYGTAYRTWLTLPKPFISFWRSYSQHNFTLTIFCFSLISILRCYSFCAFLCMRHWSRRTKAMVNIVLCVILCLLLTSTKSHTVKLLLYAGRLTHDDKRRRKTTDAREQNNTGPLGGPVIIFKTASHSKNAVPLYISILCVV